MLSILLWKRAIFPFRMPWAALQNTENTLWAESAGYIADRYYEEQEEAQISK